MKSLWNLLTVAAVLVVPACADDATPTGPVAPDEASLDAHRGRSVGGRGLTVMTQNLYVGTDVDAVIAALASPDPDDDIPALLTAVATVERTDFPARARALAREIRRRRPEVIGLQEVSVIGVDIPPLGVSVHLDFLQILQAALHAEGLEYAVGASQVNFTAAPAPGISLSDLDVILVDQGRVTVTATSAHTFSANLGVVAPGVDLQRGWVTIEAEIGGRSYTIANTHTEGTGPDELLLGLHQYQLMELVATLGTASPAIVLGDLNTTPGTPGYDELVNGGFTDAWATLRPGVDGFTCCHLADLSNLRAPFTERIDYVWTRGLGDTHGRHRLLGQADLYGDVPSDRIRNSAGQLIWPSDHAGLTANILLPPGHSR